MEQLSRRQCKLEGPILHSATGLCCLAQRPGERVFFTHITQNKGLRELLLVKCDCTSSIVFTLSCGIGVSLHIVRLKSNWRLETIRGGFKTVASTRRTGVFVNEGSIKSTDRRRGLVKNRSVKSFSFTCSLRVCHVGGCMRGWPGGGGRGWCFRPIH